jgi:F-type H+-transporting ATPase subunit gamma
MSDTIDGLRRQIASATNLQTVVRAMKAITAASIGQYQSSVRALADYSRTIELGLGACLRGRGAAQGDEDHGRGRRTPAISAIIIGSDQGLVGQFNEVIARHALAQIAAMRVSASLWAVGQRVHARLAGSQLPLLGQYRLPLTVNGITPLVNKLLLACEERVAAGGCSQVYVFHNRPLPGACYEPSSIRLLPLDAHWEERLSAVRWPSKSLPEVMLDGHTTLRALVREYLFISLFRACAESLAAENASRLAAMDRAEQNIGDVLTGFHASFHRMRQSGIDEELFDVVAGFESQATPRP